MTDVPEERLARFDPAAKTAQTGDLAVTQLVPEGLLERVRALMVERHRDLLEASQDGRRRREQLRTAVGRLLLETGLGSHRLTRDGLVDRLVDYLVGYGPLEPLLADPTVTEIMVNGPDMVYVERGGRIEPVGVRFRDEQHLEDVIARIVAPLGRRIDYSLPFVDARLPDGSRVHAIIRPLAVRGPALTIRKFARRPLTAGDLVRNGTLSEEMADFLSLAVRGRCNLLISGGAGSGKTTTLNVLSAFIPDGMERIVTIEDAAELQLDQQHVVALESRPPNLEGKGEITVRMLLRNALRMRPDRIIIGECRGGEAFDLLQAMNTGHEGCMSTIHANSCADALVRLENMVLMAGESLPHEAVRAQVRAGVDIVVHQARFRDGTRRITEIALARADGKEGTVTIFRWNPERAGFERVGNSLPPRLLARLRQNGLSAPAWLATGGEQEVPR